MAAYSIKHYLLSPLLVAGTVFSCLTLPLAIMSSVQVRKEPVFSNQLRDNPVPWLGFAAAMSLGVAVSSVAMMSNRQSSRQSAKIKQDLSSLQQNIQEIEAKIEQLRLSESHLKVCGSSFLLPDKASPETLTVSVTKSASQRSKIASGGWESLKGRETMQRQWQQMQSHIKTLEIVLQDSPEFVAKSTEVSTGSQVQDYTMVADMKRAA
jgi:DNA-binding protein YbaB